MDKAQRRAERFARRVFDRTVDEGTDRGLTPYLIACALVSAAWTVLEQASGTRGASATFADFAEEFAERGSSIRLY